MYGRQISDEITVIDAFNKNCRNSTKSTRVELVVENVTYIVYFSTNDAQSLYKYFSNNLTLEFGYIFIGVIYCISR